MSKLLYLKVIVLGIALIMIFYVIRHLSPDHVNASLQQIGIAPPATGVAVPPPVPLKIELCRTRVSAIVWPDGRKVQELKDGLKMRWQAFNLNAEDIGYMDVEKWFSLHCSTNAAAHLVSQTTYPDPSNLFVTFEYVDGTHEQLMRSKSGAFFIFAGQAFESPELAAAFADLETLAHLKSQGP